MYCNCSVGLISCCVFKKKIHEHVYNKQLQHEFEWICNKQIFDYIKLALEIFMTIIKYFDALYISWHSLLSTNLWLFAQCNKQTNTFPLRSPVSNNSVLSTDIWHISWLSFLCRNVSLFTQTNKQTITEQYLMWCFHFTQDVPQCPNSAHFIAIYICHFLFQLNPK